jgi:hypothetical protein
MEQYLKQQSDAATTRRGFGPLRLLSGTHGAATTFSLVRVPFWPLLLVLPIPLLWLCRAAQLAHRQRGMPLCPACGYDLTGCLKRCAECGWTMPYPLALSLALRRDALNRTRAAAHRPAAQRAARPTTTKPTESPVGPQ